MDHNEKIKEAFGTVMDTLTVRDFLEQLAEEAAELSHAALKAIRALRLTKNWTPVSDEEALAAIQEEFNDVLLLASIFGLSANEEQIDSKLIRWADRLAGEDNEEPAGR